jgi:EAL domain-containing protein (putative c-di-GMP-specific phosphodiesterase class I)
MPLWVAVNVSGAQVSHEHLVDSVRTTLYDTGLAPELLVLEVTETALLEGTDRALANVETLRVLGARVALDDFGTGYSSLSYLKNVPADEVKIDQSFVAGMCDNDVDRAIVAAIVGLADALGRGVVAEGVETEEQLAELRRLGCRFGQGFLWSPAINAEDLLARVQSEHPRVATV